MTVRIKSIDVINTAPEGINLTVVKVITTEPGLFGLGCATFSYRHELVEKLIKDYMEPLLIGRDVSRIEELWQLMHQNAYWRNGGVENNAISGIDMALWDIKGKIANMPCYVLLGGKVREGIRVYRHADGENIDDVLDKIDSIVEEGVNVVRVQLGGYGQSNISEQNHVKVNNAPKGIYIDSKSYMDNTLKLFEKVNEKYGNKIELIHDVHGRVSVQDVIRFSKSLEKYNVFYLEDALTLDDIGWSKNLRDKTSLPIAIGELFNNPMEYKELISNRLIDYIRVHISQIGGVSSAKKLQVFSEYYGVKTAWHGPGDMSPIGHAANVHIGLSSTNFGIQEWSGTEPPNNVIQEIDTHNGVLKEVFKGMPVLENGYVYANDKPGWGIEIDEKLAKKFPCKKEVVTWTQTRKYDGSLQRP